MANPPQLTPRPFPTIPEDMKGLLLTIALVSMGIIIISMVTMTVLNGMVTRLRAQYNHKRLQLDSEYDEQSVADTNPTSFFVILARVRRIEGWSGMYKGLGPTLLDMLIAIFVSVPSGLLLPMRSSISGRDRLTSPVPTLVFAVLNILVHLPLLTLINRAITTRHKLPCFNALHSLCVLLTPTERRRPWVLYQTPGLLASLLLQHAYTILYIKIRLQFLLLFPQARENFLLGLPVFFASVLANTFVLTPLQVIFVRLSLQQNEATPELNCTPLEAKPEGADAAEMAEHFGAGENVISLRMDSEVEPYTGLIDCAKKIIDEEGWGALYRAWWWTMFTVLGLALS